jgi:hypothetical protein
MTDVTFNAYLKVVNFRNANLKGSAFHCTVEDCDFTGACLDDVTATVFDGCNFRGATFQGALLEATKFHECNLEGISFIGAILDGVEFHNCNLENVDLSMFPNVEVRDCNIKGATIPPDPHVIQTGKLTVFKKVQGDIILTLEIPEDARRVQVQGSRKCRAEKALVVAAHELDGTPASGIKFYSLYEPRFVYEVGKMAKVGYFDTSQYTSCGAGIHFFMTRGAAKRYTY